MLIISLNWSVLAALESLESVSERMSSDFHKEAVFNSADLDLINTSNITTCDLTPVNKCSCSVIDFWLLHFLVCLPWWGCLLFGPFRPCPSRPCPSLCLTWVLQKENLRCCWACFPFMTSSLNSVPNTAWQLHYGFVFFFPRIKVLQQEIPTWHSFFLPQASPTCSFTSYFTGRIESIWCAPPHFSKTSSLSPFILLLPPFSSLETACLFSISMTLLLCLFIDFVF